MEKLDLHLNVKINSSGRRNISPNGNMERQKQIRSNGQSKYVNKCKYLPHKTIIQQ